MATSIKVTAPPIFLQICSAEQDKTPEHSQRRETDFWIEFWKMDLTTQDVEEREFTRNG